MYCKFTKGDIYRSDESNHTLYLFCAFVICINNKEPRKKTDTALRP